MVLHYDSHPPFDETWLHQLKIQNFRNFRFFDLCVEARPVVITGPNGAGKTNLLEAISFLSHGRGLRSARLGDLASLSLPHKNWAIYGSFYGHHTTFSVATGQANAFKEKRVIKLDHKILSSHSALNQIINISWLTPAHDRLLQEGPSQRRAFFDRLITLLLPDHLKYLTIYERSLKERAKLLSDLRPDAQWLTVIEERIIKYASFILENRFTFCDHINALASKMLEKLPLFSLKVEGEIEEKFKILCKDNFISYYKENLFNNRSIDKITKRTQLGPHRTDFQTYDFSRQLSASLCSTGEQKALLISIILVHTRLLAYYWQRPPLLLLDEVIAHLDEGKREDFCQEIVRLGLQAWLTGTDQHFFYMLESHAQFFKLRNAEITSTEND